MLATNRSSTTVEVDQGSSEECPREFWNNFWLTSLKFIEDSSAVASMSGQQRPITRSRMGYRLKAEARGKEK